MTDLASFLLARTCNVDGCERGGKLTRGMCAKHYKYWQDHTPKAQRPPAPRFRRKFEDFIDKSGDCWIWTGPTDKAGYGRWSGGGVRGLAHRISLTRAQDPPDPALFACHHCDVKLCVRPNHLYWGTAKDNARDYATRQGVHNKGKHVTHCKRGHEIAGANLRIAGSAKRRICRECDNLRSRERQRRLREVARAAA